MAVPAKRKSSSRSRIQRHANMRIRLVQHNLCKNCQSVKIAYSVCRKCGYYNSRQIVNYSRK